MFMPFAETQGTTVHFISVSLTPWLGYSQLMIKLGLLLLLLLFKEVGSARLRESDVHPISPKTPAPQYQRIDRKKGKGKIVEDNSMDRAA